jgi:beta-glucosidase/6-phospho-beta-glucosidase/beta-galactosidase
LHNQNIKELLGKEGRIRERISKRFLWGGVVVANQLEGSFNSNGKELPSNDIIEGMKPEETYI